MRAAIDTGVWVSGLIVPTSPAGNVVNAVRDGRATPVVSWELAAEISAVLRHSQLHRYRIGEAEVADLLGLLRPHLPHVQTPPAARSPGGPPVVSAALSGGNASLVTDDKGLLRGAQPRRALRAHGVEMLTPTQFVAQLEQASPLSPFLNPDGSLSPAYFRGWLKD
jgi:putative PIN family toxin of toxin-antitoxin system